MKASPLVSVVIPCFNSVRYLAQAIESAMNQTYRSVEILVVDDCSTDGTVALIREFGKKDDRIRLIQHQQWGGRPAITRNTGLTQIRGDFLCFLDSDDYYHAQKVESQVTNLLDHPECVAAFHDVDLVDGEGRFIRRYLHLFPTKASDWLTYVGASTYLCDRRFFVFQSVVYAAIHTVSVMIAVERFGRGRLRFDERYQFGEDTDMWIRLGLAGPIVYVDTPLASYRQHEANITRNKIKNQEDLLLVMEDNYRRVIGAMNNTEREALKARISADYAGLGWMYRCKNVPRRSIRAYLRAWKWSGSARYLIHAVKAFLPARGASE